MEPNQTLFDMIEELKQRIEILEEESIETSNTLYEIMNSVDAVDRRIDILMGEALWKTALKS